MWTMKHRILMSSSCFFFVPKEKAKIQSKALRINSKARSIYVTMTPLEHITRTLNNELKESHRDLFMTHTGWVQIVKVVTLCQNVKLTRLTTERFG